MPSVQSRQDTHHTVFTPHSPVVPLPTPGHPSSLNPHLRQPANAGLTSPPRAPRPGTPTDPEQSAEPGEEEGDGTGIGEEDEEEGEGDEDDDERESEDEDDTNPPRRTRRPQAAWLIRAFKVIVGECEKRTDSGLPPLYAIYHTFWTSQKSNYFLLSHTNITPTDLFHPQFFIWDPQCLYKDLRCPRCNTTLYRHGVISRPRRCVGIDVPFWIIGYRYRCPQCKHPKTGKATVTWRSWDRRILNVLPPVLAAEFPALLTHRSGISKAVFSWMRSCIQNGMGVKQVSDSLRVQYLLHYDELHLQYLDSLVMRRGLASWQRTKFQSFLPFNDTSAEGYHGYVPSGQLLRNIYDRFIEEHRADITQHMAMLTADIIAIDHSHKVCNSTSHKIA